jgi:methylmalonyl-CoA mutase N-terminal domain/subunit
LKNDKERLEETYQNWKANVWGEYVKKHPERQQQFKNDVGHIINPVYTPLDLEKRNFDYLKDVGFPGAYPFTRGVTPSMNRGEVFGINVYAGFGNAEQCNDRFRKIVAWGADELQIAADLPTQIGYDSDHVLAKGEIGRVGVAIDSLEDMEILFDGIPLNSVKSVNILVNSMGPIGLALYLALGEKQGLKPSDYLVDLQNDPLKEYIARGTYIFPMENAVKLACDAVEWCINNAPHWRPITFCGNHINAAGAGSTNATAYAMANGFVYIKELLSRGYTMDQIGPLLCLYLDEREDFFVTVAAGRAARKVWSQKMREKFGATKPEAMALRMSAYSHGGETLKEPINNVVRIGYAALAYALAGVNFLYNASFDEAMATPNDEACKVNIRTSQIIAYELGFSKTVDPLGGSYYIESMTSDIANNIFKELEKIEKDYGDSINAIKQGYYQGVITRGAIRRMEEFEQGERVSVGVNKFKSDEQLPLGAFKIDPKVEETQLRRLNELKARRDAAKVRETLEGVRQAALNGQNSVEPVLAALKAYATIGEICNVWREVYGEHQVTPNF